jgi:hypothetical protein
MGHRDAEDVSVEAKEIPMSIAAYASVLTTAPAAIQTQPGEHC